MSEHRRKQQSGRGERCPWTARRAAAARPAAAASRRAARLVRRAPPAARALPAVLRGGPGGGPVRTPWAPAAGPRLTRAEMRKGSPGQGPAPAARAAQGEPAGPKPKRFIDYPRWGKDRRSGAGCPRSSSCSACSCSDSRCLVGLVGYAYANVKIPDAHTATALQNNIYYWADGSQMARRGEY